MSSIVATIFWFLSLGFYATLMCVAVLVGIAVAVLVVTAVIALIAGFIAAIAAGIQEITH